MKKIKIDPVRRTAQAGPGLMVREVISAVGQYGLAPVLGACPTVGTSGLTLGGGLVDLSGRYGAACDNLLSAQLVTADGRTVIASATQNPELFWAIRGGGGNFGIATSLDHRLYAVPELLHGDITYRFIDARDGPNGIRRIWCRRSGRHASAFARRPAVILRLAAVPIRNKTRLGLRTFLEVGMAPPGRSRWADNF